MSSLLFVDKYKPKLSKHVVGGEYAARELVKWLKAWKNRDTPKAFMLSGPPGIGKSLLVELVLAETGVPNAIRFDSLKKRTRAALRKVEEAFGTRKIDAYFSGKMQRSKPGAVIMDDLDSMLTSADQGGIPQLVSFLKTTKVPIVCICNDPNNKAIQPLRDKCQHVRMQRPTPDVIATHLAYICKEQKSKFALGQIRVIAASSGGDVRQAVNELQFALSGNGSPGISMAEGTGVTVDRPLNPFDATSALFKQYAQNGSRETGPLLQLAARAVESDQYLAPMMVHENYVRASQADFDRFADAADAMSLADVTDGRFGTAPEFKAAMSVAAPCFKIGAKLGARAEFPLHMTHTAEINKRCRTMAEVADRMSRGGVHHSTAEVATECMGFMDAVLVQPMVIMEAPKGGAQVQAMANSVAARLSALRLTRTDWDYIAEAADFPVIRTAKKRKLVPPAARSALTRAMQAGKKPPKKKGKPDPKEKEEEEEPEGDDMEIKDQ